VIDPVPSVFIFPVVGEIAPPELPVKVSTTVDPAVTAIVILLLALVIEIPVPAVNVEAAGEPAVDPIITCPSVASAVKTGIPVVPVVRTARLAVASPATTFADDEYRICETVVVDG
jgi:hypothetical protein